MTLDFQPHSLGAFRACRHGDAIAYRATLESTGPKAVAALLRQLENAGLCAPHSEFSGEMDDGAAGTPDYYAVLDIIDANGSWADNLTVPTRADFDQLRDALSLRINSSDCEHGCV